MPGASENEAIDKAVEIAQDLGGRAVLLKVSGPFHSSLLKEASDEFYEAIKKVDIKKVEKTIYSNVKGLPYEEEDDIRFILKKHIMSSVYFEKEIQDMINKGVNTFVEVGPGKALRGFVKKIDKNSRLLNVEDMESLNNALNELKEGR